MMANFLPEVMLLNWPKTFSREGSFTNKLDFENMVENEKNV